MKVRSERASLRAARRLVQGVWTNPARGVYSTAIRAQEGGDRRRHVFLAARRLCMSGVTPHIMLSALPFSPAAALPAAPRLPRRSGRARRLRAPGDMGELP
jgi:hypothetical protein